MKMRWQGYNGRRFSAAAPFALLLLLAALVTVLATVLAIATGGTDEVRLERVFAGPALDAPLGRDELGRSLLPRVIAGGALSLSMAFAVVAVSACVGTLVGVVGGWAGGTIDQVIVRVIDIILAFPGILLAIALAGTLGPGIDNVFLALAASGWVGFARLARAQTLAVRQREHLAVARALGTPAVRAIRLHVLPLIAAPLLVEASFGLAAVVIAEAGLSFLGLGVQAPTPSWGSMLRDGMPYLPLAPHLVLVPGSALFATVVVINLLGDRLRDRLGARTST